MSDNSELLSVTKLSRYYGAVAALVDVNFAVEPGQVLGIVGQRGSGKSTLFQLLSGVVAPSGGQVCFDGKRVALKSTQEAQRLGIATVHQYPQLADNLDVLSNVFLGRELRAPGLLHSLPDVDRMLPAARDLLDSLGLPPHLIAARAAVLSNEQRQIVALARALCRPCRLLLLDDALGALSFQLQQALLERVKELAAQNVAVIISSDDLKHIFAVTDHILVLYQGRQLALRRTAESTPREIVELIVGSRRQEQVTPVIWAFENYYAAQQQAEELRAAQQALRQSLEQRDSLNRELIVRLRNQVDAGYRLNMALQEAGRRLFTEREAERKALARELHDQVVQDLLSYIYQLEEVENDAAVEDQRLQLEKIRSGVREVVGSLRQLCSDLRPPTIDSHGLSAAIRSLSSQWTEQSGIPVELGIDPALGRLPETIELSVFRIIQEGLNNVRKHAAATRVNLTLERTPDASLVVRLIDNGQGPTGPIDPASLTQQKHFGLVGIGERVSLLGGTLKVTSPEDGGLELLVEIPSPYPSISR